MCERKTESCVCFSLSVVCVCVFSYSQFYFRWVDWESAGSNRTERNVVRSRRKDMLMIVNELLRDYTKRLLWLRSLFSDETFSLSSRQEQQNQRLKKSIERRHHDNDHRYQVEERRRKQEEENQVKQSNRFQRHDVVFSSFCLQAKFEEILRRNQQRFSALIDNRK